MKSSKIIVRVDDARNISLIAIRLPGPEDAVALAKRLVERTGRAVTIRDEDGTILETIRVGTKH